VAVLHRKYDLGHYPWEKRRRMEKFGMAENILSITFSGRKIQ
jgi:hypothetical protein